MYSRPIHLRAAERRRAGLLAFAAIFWLAQLQGFSHLVSHVARDQAAPHALVCGDCIAAADAGAVPVSSPSTPAIVMATGAAPALPRAARRVARLPTAYRSRAPPVIPS